MDATGPSDGAVTGEANVAVETEPREGSSSQSAAPVGVTTTPAGTGKPVPARRARLAALVPTSACARAASSPAASASVTIGGLRPNRCLVGHRACSLLRACAGGADGARLGRGHSPQPEIGELIDDLLQLQGRRAASAWPGLCLRSGEQTNLPIARVEACPDSDGAVRRIDDRVGPPCQRFVRNCAIRNLTSPHALILGSAFHLGCCVATRGSARRRELPAHRWHARGQGFKSPQLHQAQRNGSTPTQGRLPENAARSC